MNQADDMTVTHADINSTECSTLTIYEDWTNHDAHNDMNVCVCVLCILAHSPLVHTKSVSMAFVCNTNIARMRMQIENRERASGNIDHVPV